MQQKTHPVFQELLKPAKQEKLDICNMNILNKRVATVFPTSGLLDSIIDVQKNKTRHLIN